jgi:flagella basal body P-ring formation protein FlgA
MEVSMRLNDVMPALPARAVIASRSFTKDGLILRSATKSRPDIVRNAGVNIVFASDEGLNIRMDGVALGEGNIGERVLVRSLQYNKIHSAEVSGQNEVMVRI